MVNIKQLWWQRYRWLMVIALVASLAWMAFLASGRVSSYHEAISAQGVASAKTYRDDLADYHKDPKTYVKPTDDFQAWQLAQVRIYDNPQASADQIGVSHKNAQLWRLPSFSTGEVVEIVLIIASLLIGAFAAAWDHLSQFDRFIFGLGTKRQRYYWWRTGGLVGLVALATVLSFGTYWAVLLLQLPGNVVNLSWSLVVAILGYNGLLAIMGVLLGQLIGLLVANPVAVGIVSVGSMVLGYVGVQNLSMVALRFGFPQTFSLDSPQAGFWPVMVGAMILALWALFFGSWVYRRLSLDYPGWLRLRQALIPTSIAAAILVISAETYFDSFHGDVRWIQTSLMLQAITLIVVLGVAFWHHRRMVSD